jgi:hypothetical protein
MMIKNIILNEQSGLIFLILALLSSKLPFQEMLVADDKSENVTAFALGAPVGRKYRLWAGFPTQPSYIWM